MAGTVATFASAPLNYVRNIQYASPAHGPVPGIGAVLRQLWHDAANHPTASDRFHYIQQRLRLGWGSARVVVGMALGQAVFDAALHQWERTEAQYLAAEAMQTQDRAVAR